MVDQGAISRRARTVPTEHQRGRTRSGRAASLIHTALRDEIVRMQLKPLRYLEREATRPTLRRQPYPGP